MVFSKALRKVKLGKLGTLISNQNFSINCCEKSVTICLWLVAKYSWSLLLHVYLKMQVFVIFKWHKLQTILHCATNLYMLHRYGINGKNKKKKKLEVIKYSPENICSLVFLQGFLQKVSQFKPWLPGLLSSIFLALKSSGCLWSHRAAPHCALTVGHFFRNKTYWKSFGWLPNLQKEY